MEDIAVRATLEPGQSARAAGERPDHLRRRLARARVRLADAVPYSPDWDAAMAEIDDLERLLAAAEPRDAALASNDGATAAA